MASSSYPVDDLDAVFRHLLNGVGVVGQGRGCVSEAFHVGLLGLGPECHCSLSCAVRYDGIMYVYYIVYLF